MQVHQMRIALPSLRQNSMACCLGQQCQKLRQVAAVELEQPPPPPTALFVAGWRLLALLLMTQGLGQVASSSARDEVVEEEAPHAMLPRRQMRVAEYCHWSWRPTQPR